MITEQFFLTRMHLPTCCHAPQVILALTEDNKLHVSEVLSVLRMVQNDVNPQRLVGDVVASLPTLSRQIMLSWADKVLVS